MNRMFSAENFDGRLSGIVAHYAKDVRVEFGEMFHPDDWRSGWELAKADGWRVVRVVMIREKPFDDVVRHLETHISPILAERLKGKR